MKFENFVGAIDFLNIFNLEYLRNVDNIYISILNYLFFLYVIDNLITFYL